MLSSTRIRAGLKIFAVALALALPVATVVVSSADARVGGGSSSGSRGSRTFAPPPATKTAPNAAQPMQRTITQPGVNAPATAAAKGGLFSRPGLLGGLAAGFLGAGLLGLLFGGSLFGGLGGLSSIIGLLIQIALIALVAKLALTWWRNRQNAASFASGPSNYSAGEVPPQQPSQPGGGNGGGFGSTFGSAFGPGGGQPQPVATPIEIKPDDYDAFQHLLEGIQAAWSSEDKAALAKLTTPEMESYLLQDLAANAEKGVVNKVTDVKLLQGDLAEAWREGSDEYATVAMRFGLVDRTTDRASGRIVAGSDQPIEATEVWTFLRSHGGPWVLAAIQQT